MNFVSHSVMTALLGLGTVMDCSAQRHVAGQEGTYLYSDGKRVPVRIANDRVAVRLRDDAPAGALRTLMERYGRLRVAALEQLEQFSDQRIYVVPLNASLAPTEFESTLAELRRDALVDVAAPVIFIESSGAPLVMTDRIVVRLKDAVPADTAAALFRRYDLEVVRTSAARPRRVLLRLRPASGRNALEVANAIYETGLVEHAQPDFFAKTERRDVRKRGTD